MKVRLKQAGLRLDKARIPYMVEMSGLDKARIPLNGGDEWRHEVHHFYVPHRTGLQA